MVWFLGGFACGDPFPLMAYVPQVQYGLIAALFHTLPDLSRYLGLPEEQPSAGLCQNENCRGEGPQTGGYFTAVH